MFKRAIAILAFSIFLFSCAAQITTQPSPVQPPSPSPPILLPDLTISDISLSETGRVEVMISNIGKGPVPYRVGSMVIYVDGHLKWRDSLGTLPDQTFLQPGGFVLYTTPVALVGRHEIRVIIDNEKKMVEENEATNVS